MNEQRLIVEFEKTRKMSKNYTIPSTIVYTNDKSRSHRYNFSRLYDNQKNRDVQIEVIKSDTVSALQKYANEGKVALLNFADAYEPGGLVLYGETTQEECLCRSSNLYDAITEPYIKESYYDYNCNNYPRGEGTNEVLYVKDVTFFRDAQLNAMTPIVCDVITNAAPHSHTTTDAVVEQRMINILTSSVMNDVDVLVLGAWGCGAFGNDIVDYLRKWKKVIAQVDTPNKIVFAMLSDGYMAAKEIFEG